MWNLPPPPPFRPPPNKYTKINTYTKTILWTIVLHGLFRECSVGRHIQSAICWGLSPCQRMVSLVSDWRFLAVECVGVTWQEGYHDEQFTRLHCQIWQPLSFGLFKLPAINLKVENNGFVCSKTFKWNHTHFLN